MVYPVVVVLVVVIRSTRCFNLLAHLSNASNRRITGSVEVVIFVFNDLISSCVESNRTFVLSSVFVDSTLSSILLLSLLTILSDIATLV
ncbi:hypothetical protein BDF22DRAFT_692359 [Syncephalis plumigaleata]|nr:hypothetical protein BDF22DRAFT_692359 [Syncephalis plumigaleata]